MESKPFSELLASQKKDQTKEVEAIAEATQDYAIQIQRDKGLGSKYIKDNFIRNAAVSVVQNFTGELDGIADNDYEYIKELVIKYNGVLKELEGSVAKKRFTDKEGLYIKEIIEPVLSELNSLTGPLLRARLAFRDFTKQFKPIKLADRFFGNVPIVGKMIKKKIERKEIAEKEVRGAERRASQEKARKARANIEDQVSGFSEPEVPAGDLATEEEKPTQKAIQTQVSASAAEENAKEAAEKSEEIKGIFEMIAESTYETNENVKKLVDSEKEDQKTKGGILSSLLPLAALTGLGGILSGAIAGLGTTLLTPLKALKGLIPGMGGKTPPKTTPKGSPKGAAVKTDAKGKSLVKSNVSKGKNIAKKVGKGALRVGGRAFLPLAAVMGMFDAATGVAQAGELLGKEDEELTFRDKASSGFAGFLSGLTFGLVDKKKMANKLAGTDTSAKFAYANEQDMFDDFADKDQGDATEAEQIALQDRARKEGNLRRARNYTGSMATVVSDNYADNMSLDEIIGNSASNKGTIIKTGQNNNKALEARGFDAPVNNIVAPNNVVNNNNATNVLPKMESVNTHRTIMSINDDAVF